MYVQWHYAWATKVDDSEIVPNGVDVDVASEGTDNAVSYHTPTEVMPDEELNPVLHHSDAENVDTLDAEKDRDDRGIEDWQSQGGEEAEMMMEEDNWMEDDGFSEDGSGSEYTEDMQD